MDGPLLLIVIDGFGLAPDGDGNAIARAATPVFDRLYERWPWSPVVASGLDVGLPDGIMGNSEVGHRNIGAGRVVPQDIVRISESIASGVFFDNEAFLGAVSAAEAGAGTLHLMASRPSALALIAAAVLGSIGGAEHRGPDAATEA